MAHLSGKEIKEVARKIVAENSGGIRYGQLVEKILQAHPETPRNTIVGSLWQLDVNFPTEIIKPSRGLYAPASSSHRFVNEKEETEELKSSLREEDFYEGFAEWLSNDLDEVTDAEALGGNGLRAKWGTPDVVGVYKPLASNLIKFPLEIVSAEIKVQGKNPVEAFGQAIAYRLFSSKTYLVMPSSISEEDQSRLEALCLLYGIGFILFKPNPKDPDFSVRVRAQRFSPDMFYVNEFADRLKEHDPDKFEKLFR